MLEEILIISLITIILVHLPLYLIAVTKKTDKVTDLAYGLSFLLTSYILFFSYSYFTPFSFFLLAIVTFWATRLTIYLSIRILGIKKDKRFDQIRESTIKFTGFWLLQILTVFIVILPVVLGITKSSYVTNLSIIGYLVCFIGLTIEVIADFQKNRFKLEPDNKGKLLTSGLWRYSRHPNYFGEVLFWLGLFLYVAPALQELELFIAALSPIYIYFMLRFISGVPPLEKRYDKKFGNDPKYLKYKKNTSAIIPLLGINFL
jgi:steroid 5-alpha reductase family enzyme